MIPGIPPHIPAIPMRRILQQYCEDRNLPFRLNRPEELILAFNHYTKTAQYLN